MDMGSYEKAMWASDPMGPTRKDRASGAFYPYIPDKLSGTEISLSMDAARSCARAAVRMLEESGILVQTSKNRKSGLYAAREVLDEFTLYERALATSVGDTRMERPVRRVPQRPRNVSL